MQQEYLNDADYWAKHLRVAELHETIEKLEKRIAEKDELIDLHVSNFEQLLEKSSKRIAELKSMTYCAYCGKEYPVDDDASEVGEHIKTCKKHPLFEYQQIINDQDKRITQQRKRIAELEKECAEIEIKVGEYQQYWIRQQRR